MLKTFKYRLSPNSIQERTLLHHLKLCCNLYNEGKEIKEFVYKTSGKSFTYNDLSALLLGEERYKDLYSQVLQSTLKRLETTFNNFFRRVKRGQTPGYPRWRSFDRYDSFTYPQAGFRVDKNRLFISKIGHIKMVLHRPIKGKIKTLTIRRSCDKWYACFSCEVDKKILPSTNNQIGIDLGLTNLIATSNGDKVDNPKHLKKSEERIKTLQRELSIKKKGSKNRYKKKLELGKAFEKVRNQREDFYHKLTHKLIKENDTIVIEDLNIVEMTKDTWKNLKRAISQVAWQSFSNKLLYKAEEAGREVRKVPPEGTSSTCYNCGAYKKKTLDERIHKCPCGYQEDRDIMAAKNILRAGLVLTK